MKFFQNKFIAIVALAFFINSILVYLNYLELELFWSMLFSNDSLSLNTFINYTAVISLIYLIIYACYYVFISPKEIINSEISDTKPTKETYQKIMSNEDKNQILKDIFYNYKVAFRIILYSLLFIIFWGLFVLLFPEIMKDFSKFNAKSFIKDVFKLTILFAIILFILNIVSISILLNASKEAEKF